MISIVLVGAVVGWLAAISMKSRSIQALLAYVLVGVVGAYLGVVVADSWGVGTYREVGGWVVPVLGAALPLAVLRALGAFRRLAAVRLLTSRNILRIVRSAGSRGMSFGRAAEGRAATTVRWMGVLAWLASMVALWVVLAPGRFSWTGLLSVVGIAVIAIAVATARHLPRTITQVIAETEAEREVAVVSATGSDSPGRPGGARTRRGDGQ